YNMYGIGAYDKCALDCGAQRAFDNGWFDVDTAIIEGAAFASESYIHSGQDTLYKMRWNPEHLSKENYASHQYASDVGWATKQARFIYNMYNKLSGNYFLEFDVPQFVSQNTAPKGSTEWQGKPETNLKPYPQGVYGFTDSGDMNLNLREKPTTTNSKIIHSIPTGSKVEVLGEITGQLVGDSSTWYQVKFDGKIGYAHSSYVDLLNLLEVTATNLNVRTTPNGTSLGKVSNVLLAAVLNNNNQIIRQNEWYNVSYNGKQAWISGGKDGTEFIKVR